MSVGTKKQTAVLRAALMDAKTFDICTALGSLALYEGGDGVPTDGTNRIARILWRELVRRGEVKGRMPGLETQCNQGEWLVTCKPNNATLSAVHECFSTL